MPGSMLPTIAKKLNDKKQVTGTKKRGDMKKSSSIFLTSIQKWIVIIEYKQNWPKLAGIMFWIGRKWIEHG